MKIENGSLYISDSEKELLKKEFKKLQTIDEKYGFWQEKFGLNYSLNRKNYIQEHTFEEFLIIPQNEDEIGELNHRVYSDWLKLVPSFSRKSEATKWREIFEEEISKAANKERYIENEISNVVDYVLTQNKPSRLSGGFMKRITIPPNKQFVESYNQYLKFESDFNWSAAICSPSEIQNRLDGIECAKYRIYLEGYLNTKNSKYKATKFSHDQQIMILDYFDFHKDFDKTKKGELYGPIIGRDSETTRQRFSTLDKRKNENNLNQLLAYFTELGFEEQIERVKKDIVEVKRRKNSSKR